MNESTITAIKLSLMLSMLAQYHPAVAAQERKCSLLRRYTNDSQWRDTLEAQEFAQWELQRLYALVQQ